MRESKVPRGRVWMRSYTFGVNSAPRWVWIGALVAVGLVGSTVHAEPPAKTPAPASTQTAARAVESAARQVADVAAEDAGDADDARDPGDPLAVARQGIVVLERAGKVLALGSVLNGDGRILTALSPLTHGNNIDARYADGSVTQVRIGHSDRAWDLALLVPKNARWRKGLRASTQPPLEAGSAVRAFSFVSEKSLALARTIVKGQGTLLGGDSELLQDAIELASRFKPTELGTPILDDKGQVVAIVAKACAPGSGDTCNQVPYGVPVAAVRAFLRTAPAGAVPPAPWLGIQGVRDDGNGVRGVRIASIHPQSPAAAAGLTAGSSAGQADLVVAVDGLPVQTPEALAAAINQRGVGDSVELLVFGNGRFRQVNLVLRAAPDAPQKMKK
jgi:serine protease Do